MKRLFLPIILLIVLTSGCVQGNGLTYTTESSTSPVRITATFSDKPLIGKTVSLDFIFVTDYNDDEMPVSIELDEAISLISGTPDYNLVVVDGSAHETIRIKVNEAGYHKITIKAEAESVGYTRVETIHLEVTDNNARIEMNPDARWY